MRLANHPSDSLAHFHVINSPLFPKTNSIDVGDPILRQGTWQDSYKLSEAVRAMLVARGFGHSLGVFSAILAPECHERIKNGYANSFNSGTVTMPWEPTTFLASSSTSNNIKLRCPCEQNSSDDDPPVERVGV